MGQRKLNRGRGRKIRTVLRCKVLLGHRDATENWGVQLNGSMVTDKTFIDQQNKFRGLVSAYRSKGFVKIRTETTSGRLRYGLRRTTVEPGDVPCEAVPTREKMGFV